MASPHTAGFLREPDHRRDDPPQRWDFSGELPSHLFCGARRLHRDCAGGDHRPARGERHAGESATGGVQVRFVRSADHVVAGAPPLGEASRRLGQRDDSDRADVGVLDAGAARFDLGSYQCPDLARLVSRSVGLDIDGLSVAVLDARHDIGGADSSAEAYLHPDAAGRRGRVALRTVGARPAVYVACVSL